MEEIIFNLVYTKPGGNQRVYKSSRTLVNNASGETYTPTKKSLKLYANKDNDDLIEMKLPRGFDYVVVSDANTHIERLVFPAWEINPVRSDMPVIFIRDTIAGVNTFMIHGGDSRAVKPDKVYLRMLARANGFKFVRGDL
jgi:hypothetical protein